MGVGNTYSTALPILGEYRHLCADVDVSMKLNVQEGKAGRRREIHTQHTVTLSELTGNNGCTWEGKLLGFCGVGFSALGTLFVLSVSQNANVPE